MFYIRMFIPEQAIHTGPKEGSGLTPTVAQYSMGWCFVAVKKPDRINIAIEVSACNLLVME
jgi:hypothetical protein